MAVASTDFVFYLSANRPEADDTTSGGAIALVRIMDRTVCDGLHSNAGAQLDFVSAGAGDTTQTVAVAGYGVGGEWLSETVALAGTSHVQTVNTYKHLKKCVLSATCAGIVTVKDYYSGAAHTTLFSVPVGELGQSTLFLKATANATGGATKVFYEKLFVKNTHATDAGVSCTFYNATDNKSELKFAIGKVSNTQATGGTESSANRLTEPNAGGNSYSWTDMLGSGNAVAVGDAADGNLIAAETQAIWVQLTLAAGTAPDQVCQMTLDLAGNAS